MAVAKKSTTARKSVKKVSAAKRTRKSPAKKSTAPKARKSTR